MTPAIVTNRMQSDRTLSEVKYLIIDEVHERDMETEMLLLLLHNLLSVDDEIKIVLMSATMEQAVYQHYFERYNPTTISAAGKCFDVKTYYKEQIEGMGKHFFLWTYVLYEK